MYDTNAPIAAQPHSKSPGQLTKTCGGRPAGEGIRTAVFLYECAPIVRTLNIDAQIIVVVAVVGHRHRRWLRVCGGNGGHRQHRSCEADNASDDAEARSTGTEQSGALELGGCAGSGG